MTKHQAISLKLAQWLGPCNKVVVTLNGDVVSMPPDLHIAAFNFNPFSPTTEGRAQFAECYFRAVCEGLQIRPQRWVIFYEYEGVNSSVTHDNTPESIAAATLEAIYYAIGGTDTWSVEV